MTGVPDHKAPPEFAPTPFFSLRNVPLWMGLALAIAVACLIKWAH